MLFPLIGFQVEIYQNIRKKNKKKGSFSIRSLIFITLIRVDFLLRFTHKRTRIIPYR